MIQPLWRTVLRPFKQTNKKLGIRLPHEPAIPLLGTYPEKTITEKDTRIPMFTVAQFTTVRAGKKPRCPSTVEWIKMWYIHTTKYHLAIKRSVYELVVVRWRNLEPVIQSKVSQKKKNKFCVLIHICGI